MKCTALINQITNKPLGNPSCCNSFDNVSPSTTYFEAPDKIKAIAAELALISFLSNLASDVNFSNFSN